MDDKKMQTLKQLQENLESWDDPNVRLMGVVARDGADAMRTAIREAAKATKLAAFAYRLLDVDDLGLFCSDDVKDEARRLLGMPAHAGAAVSTRDKQEAHAIDCHYIESDAPQADCTCGLGDAINRDPVIGRRGG